MTSVKTFRYLVVVIDFALVFFYSDNSYSQILNDKTFDSKIAFSSNRDGNFEIYIMNPDGSEQVRLTNNAAVDTNPVWSPDGSKIAFASNRNGKFNIYVINRDGSDESAMVISELNLSTPSWSLDSKMLMINSLNSDNYSHEIYVFDIESMNLKKLNQSPHLKQVVSWPPDGSKIVYSFNSGYYSKINDNWEIYLMNMDGSNPVNLSKNPSHDIYPVFSPDGSSIVFSSQRDYPNGKEDGVAGNWEIYIMNSDGSNQKRLTNNSSDDGSPSWSPDGSKIVFSSYRNGHYSEIYVMNSDGTNQQRLTGYNVTANTNSWPPKSGKSRYISKKGQVSQLMIIKSDSLFSEHSLSSFADDRNPSWSPVIKK